jgi:hypothetical protein
MKALTDRSTSQYAHTEAVDDGATKYVHDIAGIDPTDVILTDCFSG